MNTKHIEILALCLSACLVYIEQEFGSKNLSKTVVHTSHLHHGVALEDMSIPKNTRNSHIEAQHKQTKTNNKKKPFETTVTKNFP